ncbi:MAG: flagellar biosynthesis protein FlaG [Firmicutes bacterium HGW-Firmicutes-3]|nr:MAG: flagellar biosynthesis protein FlaG [Firmicutes bacterium HGW-Firmicutes-3]
MESPAQIQPVKSSGSQSGSAVKQQERIHIDAEVAAVENTLQQEQQVIKAIEKANKHIRTYDRRLEFSIHDTTKQIMVKVINTENDSVIREIPSEKVLDMVAHLWEISGILVDEHR